MTPINKPALRNLLEQDWALLREIRLRALQADPGVFSSSFASESQMDEAAWRSWLTSPDVGVFGLFDGSAIIGMTGIALRKDDPSGTSAILWGSWIAPNYRGQNLSQQFYEARIAWAKVHPTCTHIIVSHRASNHASKAANQKHGFVFTHTEPKTWPDGTREDSVYYALTVKVSAF